MKRKYHSPQVAVVRIDTGEVIAGSTNAVIPDAPWDTGNSHTGATIPNAGWADDDSGWGNAASSRGSWSDYER